MRLRTTSLISLYPRSWRQRYGDEMRAVLEAGPRRRADPFDLLRGALDAWLHPATPSIVPAVAALVGGGAWTIGAAAVVAQPVPTDWPGYVIDVLGFALVAAGFLLIATVGCALRSGDGDGRAVGVAILCTVVGYVAWIAALTGTATGHVDGPSLAAAQSLAMAGTLLVGVVLLRSGDERIGILVTAGPIAMLIPWTMTWLVFGATWTAVGIYLVVERLDRTEEPRGLA